MTPDDVAAFVDKWNSVLQFILLAVTALAAVLAAMYGRRSAEAGRQSALAAVEATTVTKEALALDIARLERLAADERERAKPRLVLDLARPNERGLYANQAMVTVRNSGREPATRGRIRLAYEGIMFGADFPALAGESSGEVHCTPVGEPCPEHLREPRRTWLGNVLWWDRDGAQLGDPELFGPITEGTPTNPRPPLPPTGLRV